MGIFKDLEKQEWEKICSRCGMCCHEKTVSSGTAVYHVNSPCIMLDKKTNTCKVYDNRFTEIPRCQSVNLCKAMFASYLPPDCAYVKWAERHHIRFARKLDFVYIPSDLPDTQLDD
ncbi:MAG: hypothetical protein ISR78_02625 [Spirochaetia bacterium]|nr:hypothetical protein [Spirochaetia bacterium]